MTAWEAAADVFALTITRAEPVMTKVFIGGSRRVGRLNADVRRRLDRILEKRLPVLVGDANGADKAVQQYLHSKSYDLVEVFCAGDACRNNAGNWPVRKVSPDVPARDFSFYASKDRLMADEADVGFMVWDGKSVGTVMNVLRLIQQQKQVVVYVVPAKRFVELKGRPDWETFVSGCTSDLQRRIEREATAEQRTGRALSPTGPEGFSRRRSDGVAAGCSIPERHPVGLSGSIPPPTTSTADDGAAGS